MSVERIDNKILSLGKASVTSPLATGVRGKRKKFVEDQEGVLVHIHPHEIEEQLTQGRTLPYSGMNPCKPYRMP